MKVLVTGGAGFIGSHVVDALLARGDEVVVFDALVKQVHGDAQARPDYLDARATLVVGDMRDRARLEPLVCDADAVVHHAAAVGVGQSMYDVVHYVEANAVGTAVLCEILAKAKHRVKKVLVASSMSNYGEGKCRCATHGEQTPGLRPVAQLQAKKWELLCPHCGAALEPLPTDEGKRLEPTSVYATTKRDQEELVLNVCRAYGIPAVAFRYFNVYGPRQALSNPYTGVAAIFAAGILNGKAPIVFEDGLQTRDFVHVTDVARANVLALGSAGADGCVLNVGTGTRTTLLRLFDLLQDALGVKKTLAPDLVGKFREGDIRHCFADISLIRTRLAFEPAVRIEDGVKALATWARNAVAVDRSADALAELEKRGLVR